MTEEEMKARIAELEQERDSALAEKKTALGEKFKASKAVEALTSQLSEAEDNAKAASTDEVTRLKNQLAKLTNDLSAANGKTADATKALHSFKAETEIGKLLVSHKVQPDDAPMVTAYIKSLMTIDEEGNPSFDGQAADAFGKTYFTGAGKRYTSAPDNSGGGSTGFDGTKALRMNKDNWNFTEFAKIQLDNPAEANAIADAVGRPELKTSLNTGQ